MKSSNRQFIMLLMGLILVLAALFINDFNLQRESNSDYIVNDFNENLKVEIDFLNSKFDEYFNILDEKTDDYWPLLEKINNQEKVYSFVYKHDSLLYWSTSTVHFELSSLRNRTVLINNANSWYLGVYGQLGDFRILLVEPIIQSYGVDNQFVKNEVNDRFSNSENIQISTLYSPEAYEIDFTGPKKYYLKLGNEDSKNLSSYLGFLLVCILYLLISLFVITYLKTEYSNISSINKYYYSLSFALLLLIFYLDTLIGFSQHYFPIYLQQKIPTINLRFGEVFLLSIIFLVYVVLIYEELIHKKLFENKKSTLINIYIHSLFSIFILNLIFWLSAKILKINNVTEVYSLIDMHKGIIISAWLAVSGIIIYTVLRILGLNFSGLNNKRYYTLGIFTFSSIIGIFVLMHSLELFLIITVLLIISLLIDSVLKRLKQFYILHHLIYIIAIAGAMALLINNSIEENKLTQQKYISSFLVKKGDKAIENFWLKLNKELINDTLVQRLNYQSENIFADSILDYFEEYYFNDEANGFSYQLTYCNTYDSLLLGNSDEVVHCQDFFNDLKSSIISQPEKNLYLLDNEPDNIYYLGEFKLKKGTVIYIELTSYFIPGGLAYAELLIDKKPDTPDLSDYSFAKYYQNILVSKFGDYEFHTSSGTFDNYPTDKFFNLNNYKHYKTTTSNGDTIVVSRPLIKISSKIFSFSYLFLLLAIVIVLLTSIVYGSNFNQLFNLNLRARLQMFFMIALSTITLTTAVIILFYTNKNNTEKLHAELNEKAHSVLIELQHKLSGYNSLEEVDEEEVKELLQKFSVVFFSDINLYDSQGILLATSRPQIFSEGFLSDLINPMAYEEIMVDNLLFYNCTETIGSLNYYSTYLPLFITSDKVAGIINLPFFARQTEQKKSFRFLLFTFINLFVILGIIGAIVAVLYSRLLTKPLSVLQSNISNIRIDMQNSKIFWKKDDEIGQLISEYNKMVDKLEASSEMLKRSEREIAWRELARQIAHEIKNPLTPMKLNIQYLIRAKAENREQFEEKFEDISSGLIQQIDTLDRVAEMFTDMAKSNTNNFVAVNLIDIINSMIKLYDKSENVEFNLVKDGSDEDFYTRGTEKNLTQIFNNLIKNSLEAISKKDNGLISISIESSESYLNVKFMDNGGGIPEKMKDMVFTPYFTTRTTGTGLGLAIVKSLITGMGGNIKLEKSDENGTVFLIKFLKTKRTKNE